MSMATFRNDETEDGLDGGADSANSGGPVMAVPKSSTPKLAGIPLPLTVTALCSSPTRLPAFLEMSMSR
jgi:hypothetical protein